MVKPEGLGSTTDGSFHANNIRRPLDGLKTTTTKRAWTREMCAGTNFLANACAAKPSVLSVSQVSDKARRGKDPQGKCFVKSPRHRERKGER